MVRAACAQRVQELEDQVRDVMFFLEARTKIEEGEGEMVEVAGASGDPRAVDAGT